MTPLASKSKWTKADTSAWVDVLECELFPHQESEEEQESFTPEGRLRAAKVIERIASAAWGRAMACSDLAGAECDCGHGWHLHSSSGCMAMRGRSRCDCRKVQGLPRLGDIPKMKRSPLDPEGR